MPTTEDNSRNHALLQMLAQGCSNKAIATFLKVSAPTAKKQLQNLFAGLLNEQTVHPMSELASPPVVESNATLYGLPCSKCRAYYPSDMNACPICRSPERVSPGA